MKDDDISIMAKNGQRPGMKVEGIKSVAAARRALDFLIADDLASCVQAWRDVGADDAMIEEVIQKTRQQLDGMLDEYFGHGASGGRGN
jgi:hypothetical protein